MLERVGSRTWYCFGVVVVVENVIMVGWEGELGGTFSESSFFFFLLV